MLEIQLIGQIIISRDRVPLELPRSRKTLALLGYLILTGRPQQRDHLCSLFWSDAEDPKAALRWSLSRLRPLLNDEGLERLISDREKIVFNPADTHIDVAALQRGELETIPGNRQVQELVESELMSNLDLPDCETYHFWLVAQRRAVAELKATLLAHFRFGESEPFTSGHTSEPSQVPQLILSAGPVQQVTDELTARLSLSNKFELAPAGTPGTRYQLHVGKVESGGLSVYLEDMIQRQVTWGEIFESDRSLGPVTSRITSAVVNAEFARVQTLPDADCSAWDFYIKALQHVSRYSEADILAARDLGERSVSLNPHFADAHSMIAVSYIYEGIYGWSGRSLDMSLDDARRHIQDAQHLDPNDPSVVRCAGLVQLYSKNLEAAELYFIRARELDFFDPENHAVLGLAYGVQGQYDSARESLEFALSLSPRDHFLATWCSHLALSAALAGQDTDAISWAEKCLVMNPYFPGGYRSLAVGLARQGNLEAAQRAAQDLHNLLPGLTIADVRERLPLQDNEARASYLDALHTAGIPTN